MNVRSIARIVAPLASLLSIAGCGDGEDVSGPRGLDAQGNPIVGGSIDNGHSAVALLVQDPGYICSGTIVAERVYLTAAHCIESTNPNDYVVAGGTNLNNDDPDYVIGVDAVHVHPGYSSSSNSNDVGIVELSSDSPVKPYRWMGNGSDVYDLGTSFTAVGYGDTNGSGQGAGVKRHVDMTIDELFSDAYLYGDGSNGNTCFGDSGGPDIVNNNGFFTVIGVHSFVTDGNCLDQGGSIRTDAMASFIDNYVGPNEGTAKFSGGGGGHGKNPLACSVTSVQPRSPLGASLLALVALGFFAVRRR
jgi:MYXO-CTERM domain-containing protein